MNMTQQNIVRTYVYMAILTSIVALMAYVISQASGYGSSGVGIGLIIAGVMNFVAYYFSDRIVLAQTRAKKVSEQDSPEYFEIVSSLARKANLPMPAIYIIPDTAMNAFATGRDAEHAAVAVTQGLLQGLNRDEIEGVIAHELSHIRNYDMRLMSTVSILVGMLNILANMFWQSGLMGRSSNREDSRVNSIISIILILVTPIVGMLIQLAISRQREFLADASAAEVVGSPHGLISALQKLGSSKMPLATADVSTAHLYISNPFGDNLIFTNLFSTHPPMQDRIARLEELSK
jgi:heat shock protein HtpX